MFPTTFTHTHTHTRTHQTGDDEESSCSSGGEEEDGQTCALTCAALNEMDGQAAQDWKQEKKVAKLIGIKGHLHTARGIVWAERAKRRSSAKGSKGGTAPHKTNSGALQCAMVPSLCAWEPRKWCQTCGRHGTKQLGLTTRALCLGCTF